MVTLGLDSGSATTKAGRKECRKEAAGGNGRGKSRCIRCTFQKVFKYLMFLYVSE